MSMILAAVTVAVLLIAGYAREWARLRARPRLAPPDPLPADAPLVSLLIPARNEERSIGRCVAGALAQRYPRFEVLVLDDASTDGTAAVLAGFAHDPRLRVLHGQALPRGWVGKSFACQQLSAQARGEWLLFLDADTAPQPDLAAALLTHARRRDLDLVTIWPFLELGTFWERVMLPPFLAFITTIYPLERFERPGTRPEEVLANGQCIFVRCAAYAAIGGHAAVRNQVLEDVHLAQAIRAAGFRIGGAEGPEYLHTRMYHNGREVAEGLAKHAAAGTRNSGARSWRAAVWHLMLAWGPLALMGGGAALWASGAGGGAASVMVAGIAAWVVEMWFFGALYRRRYHLSPLYALLWPIGLLAYLLVAIRGMWRVRSGRGVSWKGRTYAG
ncbi:MAG: glycosyltransferase family 2 protein [Oscillochloridaceae bacterium]|nr:glycosyltransferase [Chloroflexaceae bacterium]MDW8392106.1 glycosyltransferase family 2 protein [Oscillochloridaceae bacterium]